MDLRAIKQHVRQLAQKRSFNKILKSHAGRNDVLHPYEIAYILKGGGKLTALQKKQIKDSLTWLPKRHYSSKPKTGFFHIKPFLEKDPSFTLSFDGLNTTYTYDDVVKTLTKKFLENNYSKTVEGVELKTKLVHGALFKVEYAIYMHDLRKNEDLMQYKLYSKEFKDVESAVRFVTHMKTKQNTKAKKKGSLKQIVSVWYDTNAVKIPKRKVKLFGYPVPIFSDIEKIGRSLQRRFGSKTVRVTWLIQKPK